MFMGSSEIRKGAVCENIFLETKLTIIKIRKLVILFIMMYCDSKIGIFYTTIMLLVLQNVNNIIFNA